MKKYLITVEYFGRGYAGWQRQENALSVQQVLEEKLSLFLREKIVLFASGRTDSGVHALGQKAHFVTKSDFPYEKIPQAVNSNLPADIRILAIKEVGEDFHAQYSAKKKTYRYKFYVSRTISPTRDFLSAQIVPPIDFSLMKRGAELLVGEHDFKAFSSTGSHIKNTVRTLYRVDLTESGDEITLEVEGNGFLYNMVRIIAGSLVWLGKGKITLGDIEEALSTGNRKKLGKTYPAHGLYLVSVNYDNI